MSKIGKQPIDLPDNVQVDLGRKRIKVIGPRGELERVLPREIKVRVDQNQILVEPEVANEKSQVLQGTFRSVIFNMVKGVSQGWSRQLELVGTGYRAEVSDNKLIINVGYSHPIEIEAPEKVSFKVEKNVITVEGIDKEEVGQIAAKIRSFRPPEPYKGKGIKYIDEVVRRKAGKAAKAQA